MNMNQLLKPALDAEDLELTPEQFVMRHMRDCYCECREEQTSWGKRYRVWYDNPGGSECGPLGDAEENHEAIAKTPQLAWEDAAMYILRQNLEHCERGDARAITLRQKRYDEAWWNDGGMVRFYSEFRPSWAMVTAG